MSETNQRNILPYDGHAYLVDDTSGAFDWPKITACLAETITWRSETARVFCREMPIPRMQAWFGDADYKYSGILLRAGPLPEIVQRLRERAEEVSGTSYNAVLLNLYRNGADSVGWHSDNEPGLGERPIIASVSLGATRRFQFRHRRTKETIALELKEGHWLVMAGPTQRFWVRQVPKTKAVVGPRINLTFRRTVQTD
jgi:alkylated DNA repair dioxygenase AlkB